MSGRQDEDNPETLFSFELLVEYILIEKESKVSDELALGVRLLDFPTLLIYQPRRSSDGLNQQEHRGKDQQREYAFNRGKSCFFKMNLGSLHNQLSNTPLYAMVLDVKEEIPKLVGTSLIPLARVTGRIRQDVTEHGASTPSSHGERGLVVICNLMGEKIGCISLSYKLLSLGASLLPHITERRGLKSISVHGGHRVQNCIIEKNISTELLPLNCGNIYSPTLDKYDVQRNIQNNKPSNENTCINEDKQDNGVCAAMQTEHKPRSQMFGSEEDLTVFCPPHLFYSNSAEVKSRNEGGESTSMTLDSEAFTFEDTCSDEEAGENIIEGTSLPMMDQRVRCDLKTSRNHKTSAVTPNVLGEALQQLPLLNALLVELSQLKGQNPHSPLSIHPNLAWIYRPASTEPSAGHGNAERKAQTKSLQKTRQGTGSHLEQLRSPRNCSTPVVKPVPVKVKDKPEEALVESKSSSKSRKRLVYGTTRTFNLRLKKISPLEVKRHECMDLTQNRTLSSTAKGKTESSNTKSGKRVLNPSFGLNENVKTMTQSITVDSELQETITIKQKNLHSNVHGEQGRYSLSISAKPSRSQRDLRFIHSPSVNRDSVAQNKDKSEHHSGSNQSQFESDRHGEKIESSGSSRHSSPKSSCSDSSGEGDEEADYADDFNSLEPSDACSPDLASSPKPSRAKTPKSPIRPESDSGSGSEGFQRRVALPVPVKAPSSPQRALRGTHVIRPRTHASALSFSSDDDGDDDGDRDESASLRTVCSRKHVTKSSRVKRSSGAKSFISSRGQRSESTKNSGPERGSPAESISSLEQQAAEELENELGNLDFRKEYQHISELVANKLPGYTM